MLFCASMSAPWLGCDVTIPMQDGEAPVFSKIKDQTAGRMALPKLPPTQFARKPVRGCNVDSRNWNCANRRVSNFGQAFISAPLRRQPSLPSPVPFLEKPSSPQPTPWHAGIQKAWIFYLNIEEKQGKGIKQEDVFMTRGTETFMIRTADVSVIQGITLVSIQNHFWLL